MGSKMAPPYACLSIGYLEETQLHPILPQHFPTETAELLIRWFLRYIDDGFILWPKELVIDEFMKIINNLNPSIQFTLERSKKYVVGNQQIQELPFLDVMVIVKDNTTFTTDIFYKETNSHFYLDYNSHHPQHMKDNIPYGLAKKLICFVPNYEQLEFRLDQLKTWLLARNYPAHIIDKKIHNAKLEGPAPPPSTDNTNDRLVFTTTYTNNYTHRNTIQQINSLFHLPRTERIKQVFGNCTVMQAYKQPRNLLRHLTKAEFTTTPTEKTNTNNENVGFFKCDNKRCKLCSLYIQPCKSFITQNGTEWFVKSRIDCHSKDVLYWLKCAKCENNPVTYTGKTFNLRERMNNHITSCRLGGSSDQFDNHVHSFFL